MTEGQMKSVEDIRLTKEQDALMVAMIDDVHGTDKLFKILVRFQKHTKIIFNAGYQTRDKECAEIVGKLEMVIEHALELGYLGQGSTNCMAVDALADLKAWRESK